MKPWIFITTILIVIVCGDKWGLLHFNRDEAALFECFKNYNSGNFIFDELKERIANYFARKFSKKTVTIEDVNFQVLEVIQYSEQEFELDNNQTLRRQFENVIKKSLLDCSDDYYDYPISGNQTNHQLLPHFVDEPVELGLLLDDVLVNWPYLCEHMLSTRSRRALLRKYVKQVLNIFESAHYNQKTNSLNDELRLLFLRRARLFFNASNTVFPYINHVYTEVYTFPHTSDDTKIFIDRRSMDLRIRNSHLVRSYVDRILNIHLVNNLFSFSYNTLSHFDTYGITSLEYYLEYHLNQFYRVLLFFIELHERGIVNDEDDTYNETIPYDVIPEEIQAIVYNDTVYRNYLVARANYEFNVTDPDNKYRKNLERSGCVNEENLIMLFLTHVKSRVTTTSITTTNYTTMTTTPLYYQKSKKGSSFVNKYGKHFPKGIIRFVKKNEEGFDKFVENSKKSIDSQQQRQKIKVYDECYGYIVQTNDFNIMNFFEKKRSLFIELLNSSL